MRWRIGILDVCAAFLVLISIFLPGPDVSVESAYKRSLPDNESLEDQVAAIDAAQARLAAHPKSGAAADELARILEELGQHDQALRIGGEVASRKGPDQWRAWLAVASAHADRIEIEPADRFAHRALEACRREGADCADFEEVRLRLYVEQLDAGMQALAAGIDPRLEPDKFRRKLEQVHPTATLHPVRVRND